MAIMCRLNYYNVQKCIFYILFSFKNKLQAMNLLVLLVPGVTLNNVNNSGCCV